MCIENGSLDLKEMQEMMLKKKIVIKKKKIIVNVIRQWPLTKKSLSRVSFRR